MGNARPLIAVVDDDLSICVALRRLLRASNYVVETFMSGVEFLASLPTHQPDCVVLDIDMPQLDGLAVQKRLNQTSIRLPVVVLTGCDSTSIRALALAGGASAYLLKPVNAKALLDAIAAAIAQESPKDTPHR